MKKIIALIAAVCVVFSFAGCSSDKKADKKEKTSNSASQSTETKTTEPDNTEVPAAPQTSDGNVTAPAEAPSAPAKENTLYGDAEIYTNESGNPAAKTNDGTEVEFTTENMQKLFAEYEKESGTGSEREKELLDQIQLFLEASPNVEQAAK
ncbi:MAG: hypothetical protein J6B23_08955 [Clostridia bacterium]|nr:hypothetical protein [Clostridia bacterium]